MKTKFLKFFTISIACLGMVIPAVFNSQYTCVAAQEATYVGDLVFDRFNIDSVIEIKDTDKLKLNDVIYDINKVILKYPSGLNVNSRSFSLKEYGEYTLTMSYSNDVYCNKTFNVNGSYLISSNNTVINYGALNKQFIQKGFSEGLSIDAAEGDFIRFAKPINIYENDVTKLLYFNLVQMDQKVKNIDVRITDCYNPDLYLDILYKRGSKEILTYVSASAMGQRDYGLDKAQDGPVVLDDENYKVSEFDGTIMDSNNPVSGNYNNFMFYLDTSNKDRIRVIAETDIVYKKCIITEFNNPSIYSYEFPGFTNGNVYLSISANNFENVDYAKIEIAEACGLKGEQLKELLGANYNDDNKPIFISDLDEKVHEIRSGAEIKIPEIEALDDTGIKGEVNYTVWYNYDSNSKRMINVYDRKFMPTELGFYTIIYSATDFFGNVGEYRVDFVATTKGNSGISFVFEGFDDIVAGKSYLLNKYKIESLNGSVDVSIEVTDPSGNVELLESATTPYKVKYVGNGYQVKYIYSDKFYEGTYSASFNARSSGNPVFDQDTIPSSSYYIKGAEYSIEHIYAYTYGNQEPVAASVSSYVSYDGGAFVKCDRSKITIEGNDNGTIQFKYVANDDESSAIYSREAKIVDVNYSGDILNIGKYFDASKFTNKTTTETSLNLKATSNGDDSINFINKLYFSAFSVNLAVSESSEIEQFSVVLSDYYNVNNKITVTFGTVDGFSQYISINNGSFEYVDLPWKGSDIEVKYESETSISVVLSKNITGTETVSYSYSLTNNVALTDEYLLFSLDVKNAKIDDVISISSLMKQNFNNTVTSDDIGPVATITNIESIQELGSTIKIPKFYYIDVLSPSSEMNAKLNASQTSPAFKALVSTTGQTLTNVNNLYDDIYVTLGEFGKYQLSFDYVDGKGNKIKISESGRIKPIIYVIDEVAPTISLKSTSQKGKVNEKITPLEATVSDNVTSAEDLQVYYFVYNKQGSFCTSCVKGEQFSYSKAGEYVVYVYCADATGNTSYLTYSLIIE